MRETELRQHRCCFTGHRPEKLGMPETEVVESLKKEIRTAIADGFQTFISGMARGVDLWAAEIVLDLKKKNPALRLHCILPCEGQEDAWPMSEQERYRSILRQADEVIYVNREYTSDCMLARNRYLVEHSSVLLAVYNGSRRSGTGMTVRYAKRLGREVIVIAPVSRSVSYEKLER